jgi:hypothetical protein
MNTSVEPRQLAETAHGLNNLFTIIDGFNNLMFAETANGTRSHGFAKEIAKASVRASALTSQLLRFAGQKHGTGNHPGADGGASCVAS